MTDTLTQESAYLSQFPLGSHRLWLSTLPVTIIAPSADLAGLEVVLPVSPSFIPPGAVTIRVETIYNADPRENWWTCTVVATELVCEDGMPMQPGGFVHVLEAEIRRGQLFAPQS
jgi:hypothetical protein